MKTTPKLLILSSNPRRDLKTLNREVSDLVSTIQRFGKFEIRFRLDVYPQELTELFAEHRPEVIHFCGHGAGEQGLVFQDENGQERLVSTETLAGLFETFSQEINCVVLNACNSDQQAEAIVEHINYAVGMRQLILDQAAYSFAVGFYQGLATGSSIEQAYRLGRNAIQLRSGENSQSTRSRQDRKAEYVGAVAQPAQLNLPEHLKPVLRKKSSSFQEVPPPSAPPELPSGFVEVVQQEVERKEYKDQARAAYDNFGQFSAEPAASLTKSEYEQRQIVLGKVKQFWIEGFLKPSLQGTAAMSLDLKARPEAIADLTQGIEALSVELDASYEELRTTRTYEEIGQGRTLLILGEPGAGKTIALLQLAQRLIERSEQNLSLPLPVVFNLSSWAKNRKPIFDWLLDELREKYQVPKSLSKPWIEQQQLILLLDGLDEVNEDHRNNCVRALNEFISLFPHAEVAVCSRVRDYEALTERLQLSSALCLQPLSSEQVYQFLDSVGGSLAGLKALLKRDAELEQFAQTPLILNIMSSAYQGRSIEELITQLRSSDRHKHVFDTYIDRRLQRGAVSEYDKKDVLQWLSWLAKRMVQEKQTVFLIEKMQPTWLQNRSEERAYRIRNFMIGVLIFRLCVGLSVGLTEGLMSSVGLSIGLIAGLIAGLSKEISPLEQLNWSWQRAKSRLGREFFTGFSYGLIVVLIFRLISGQLASGNLISGLIFGLIFGLVFGLSSGLGGTEIEQRAVPNQGIQSSRKNCLIVGLGTGLIFGLFYGLKVGLRDGLFYGLIFGLFYGLIAGLVLGLKYGGVACIQHFNLRQMLHQKGCIPWNYAKFLDFASDRLLMKKVGGGYVFFHRMLLEHFAQMNPK